MDSGYLALQFVDRSNARDADGQAQLMADDFLFIDYLSNRYQGRDVMKQEFPQCFDVWLKYQIRVVSALVSGLERVRLTGSALGSHLVTNLEQAGVLF